jgi:multidrug efflux pump subunit AcrA (membrane-fusion protein)
MNRPKASVLLALMVAITAVSWARADDDKPKADPSSSAAKSETHTVAKGRFQVVVTLEGTFIPRKLAEVSLRPETWTDLTVAEAVEHGQVVKKGDMLVRLDQRKIDQEIRDEEAARKQAELAIQQVQAEIRVLEPSVPVDLAAAERAKKNADADLENFHDVDRDLTKRMMEMEVKQFQVMVDFQKDELEQLEKMYKADDLTEETEELILKRQRNWLELAQCYLDLMKAQRDRTLQIQLPRQEADLRENASRQSMALEKIRTTLPLTLNKLKLDLEKQKYDHAKASEKLKKLKHDAAALTVYAPTGGTVYYGALANGEWSGASSIAEKLKRGGSLSAHEVFMTVLEPDPLAVHVTVPEKALSELSAGLACQVTPTASSTARLRATVESIPSLPAANGKFRAVLKLADDNPPLDKVKLAPGMKCSVKAITYETAAALTVPVAALQTDSFDDQKHYVNLVDSEGKHSRRDVTVGHRSESSVEITAGLAEGDKVLLGKPPEEKKS